MTIKQRLVECRVSLPDIGKIVYDETVDLDPGVAEQRADRLPRSFRALVQRNANPHFGLISHSLADRPSNERPCDAGAIAKAPKPGSQVHADADFSCSFGRLRAASRRISVTGQPLCEPYDRAQPSLGCQVDDWNQGTRSNRNHLSRSVK